MNEGKKLSVLLIDDSEDDVELILHELRKAYEYLVEHRVDTADALRCALQNIKWDVVICDHNMPALDAPAALRIVREQHAELPFIIVSGAMSGEEVARAMMSGAADMVGKDDLTRLVPAIERELRKTMLLGDLQQARSEIDRVVHYDRQTGLPNREYLARKFSSLQESAVGVGEMTIVQLHLNRFMQIPRSMGSRTAALALQIISHRIMRCVGEAGTSASLGGDRFAILLNQTAGPDAVGGVIDNIREKLSKPIVIDAQEFFLSCTAGVSIYPRDGLEFNELLANAETAMHQARVDGVDGYLFFEPGMSASRQSRVIMEHALHRAINNREFVLHYQPQYAMDDGRITGVEALLRWQSPEYGLVPPDRFIPILEETGLIVPLGEWILEAACAQNRAWQDMGLPPIRMAVNLSAVQFRQTELAANVRRILERTGLAAEFLELEITENMAVSNPNTVIATLRELQQMGIRLAIDDFGTGYSSLSYLKRFPVHKLKVDRTFIADIGEQAESGHLVKGIVQLGRSLGLQVIAEGVETQVQADFLRACGCHEAQGYLYSRPVQGDVVAQELGKLLAHA